MVTIDLFAKRAVAKFSARATVRRRRLPDDLAENAIEMGERLETYVVGDFANAPIRIDQQRLCFLDPNSREIIGER